MYGVNRAFTKGNGEIVNKIKVLSSQIYNKISAGEVIERPANVVKELVENSLDAGATDIMVEIVGGGLEKIIIADNGHGIDSADIETAVLNHATSKIVSDEDLYNIATFGFRGEALASICAVSDVTILSKTDSEELGVKAEFNNGALVNKTQVGLSTGTTIEVNELFKYVPARLKFLKKEKSEEQEVYSILTKFVLANFKVRFKLVIDGKVKLDYFGSSLTDAIREIYGADIANNLIEVAGGNYGIGVKGFIGKPSIARPSRINQTIFVNNRYITNQTVLFAVERVFENYLMKGMHPFFVINITLDPKQIDVNVHPKKLEVRFSDQSKVFSAVYGAINNAILNNSAKSDLKETALEDVAVASAEPAKPNNSNFATSGEQINRYADIERKLDILAGEDLTREYKIASPIIANPQTESAQSSFINSLNAEIEKLNLINEQTEKQTENLQSQNTYLNTGVKVLGQIFNEFCLVSKGETLYIIDEHAMHERILFDKFSEQVNNENLGSTDLLAPIIVELSPIEEANLVKIEDDLKALGFDITNYYKNEYRVDRVPSMLMGMNIKKFLSNVLSREFIAGSKAELIKSKLAREACRAAVKAGKSLTESEIIDLINSLKPNTPMLCPHGRPAVIELSRDDLEKLFKRKL